jgi:acyl carrier protein
MQYTKQDVFNTLLKIAQDTAGTPAPKYANLNSSIQEIYYDMYMDSLDEIEIVMKLEKHYGITIPDGELMKYRNKNFDDFCGYICSLVNNPQKQPVSLASKIKSFFQHQK